MPKNKGKVSGHLQRPCFISHRATPQNADVGNYREARTGVEGRMKTTTRSVNLPSKRKAKVRFVSPFSPNGLMLEDLLWPLMKYRCMLYDKC